MEMGLEGKIMFVAGGVSGVGSAIVEGFVKEGASVVVADIRLNETLKLVGWTIGR
jgi:NAD(P)-dependent dehydrogenase (short-subunit alcohol dehydrogenase family)